MKKRSTLPNDFRQLLAQNDMDVLKAVFQKCDVNAKTGRYGSNAFELTPLPREFAVWLKEQGGDVNASDYYGDAPIFAHAGAYNGDVGLLAELGADVNTTGRNRETPLHKAARYGRTKAAQVLIQYGADVNARHKDELMGYSYTPLETALLEQRVQVDELVVLCRLLLDNGAQITEKARKAVADTGKAFELRKRGFKEKALLERQELALKDLYDIFDVVPAEAVVIHDGISPIMIKESTFGKQYNKLWEFLVPPSGCAETAQGEVIRIVGKVSYEILDNGGMNWDQEFRKMLDILPLYFGMGNPLSAEEMEEVVRLIKRIYSGNGEDEPEKLTRYAVAWVLKNQDVIAVVPPSYTR